MDPPLPYRDFTLKARVTHFEGLRHKLQALGATCVGTDDQTDTYLQTDRGKLKWRRGTLENLITEYERINRSGIEQTVVYRYEPNPSAAAIEALLASSKILGTVVKTRSIYRLGHLKIHLDTLPDGRHFLEVEAQDHTLEIPAWQLQAACESLLTTLGIEPADRMPTGYLIPEPGA